MIDSTHAIVAYTDNLDSNKLKAVCLSLSGTTISAGTPLAITSAGGQHPALTKIDTNKAILSYKDNSDSKGYVRCLSLSGTTITAGTAAPFENSTPVGPTSVCATDTTHAIVGYMDSSNKPTVCGMSLSGTTLTVGTAALVVNEFGDASALERLSIVALDSTHAVFAYVNASQSDRGECTLVTLSGTTATAATPVVFNNATTLDLSAMKSYSNTVEIAFNSTNTKTVKIVLSGGVITASSATTILSTAYSYLSYASLGIFQTLLSYRGGSGYATAVTINKV
jgi:hypothetical protein